MRVLVGTSGWSFKEWKGSFYPADLAAARYLSYYSERFPTVEINNTFYRMPKESVLVDWTRQVSPGFRFGVKASQRITHYARLKNVADNLAYFLRVVTSLGDCRGPSLFQLPPNLKKDLPLLTDFLDLLPARWRATVEFRHATWLSDDVYEALRAKDVALCISDQDEFSVPPVATAGWGYLRLHKATYSPEEMDRWAQTVRGLPWEEAFVYFKHDEVEGSGPDGATAFQKLVGEPR